MVKEIKTSFKDATQNPEFPECEVTYTAKIGSLRGKATEGVSVSEIKDGDCETIREKVY